MLRWVLFTFFIGVCASVGEQSKKNGNSSRGWGTNIDWAENYKEGLNKMVISRKPLMVIHHLDICPYSQALKKAFVADKDIQKMAKEDFVMLNVVEETGDENLANDGYYVPRIVFVDPSMTVRNDITGMYSERLYTYTPNDLILLAENMKKAKAVLHNEL